MSPSPRESLRHILDEAEYLRSDVEALTREEFLADPRARRALVKSGPRPWWYGCSKRRTVPAEFAFHSGSRGSGALVIWIRRPDLMRAPAGDTH